MESQLEHKIPVIDFTKKNLKPGSDSWVLACKQVRYGLEEYGCFKAVYDKVEPQLHNSIFTAAEELFALPIETKRQKTSDRPWSNYVGQNPLIPLYESAGLDNPTIYEASESFTRTMWPQGNDIFRYVINYNNYFYCFLTFYLRVHGLFKTLRFYFLDQILVKVFVPSQNRWWNFMKWLQEWCWIVMAWSDSISL